MNSLAVQIESRVRQLSRSASAAGVAYRCGVPLATWQAVLEIVKSNPCDEARPQVAERFGVDTANRIFEDLETVDAAAM